MEARKAHWKQSWSIPGTPWTILGYSRAAYRTGFFIPQLNIMLDAGPQNFNNPDHIFITHTHCDHIACLPYTMIRDDKTSSLLHVYGPAQSEELLRKFIAALFDVTAMTEDLNYRTTQDQYFTYHGLEASHKARIVINKSPLDMEIFQCDHSVPTISYGFSVVKTKLKEEYLGLHGKAIAALKKAGAEITKEVINPTLAYVCDTSIKVLEDNPSILSYSVVFIECTFLYSQEIENAAATKHIHWEQLRPYVLSHPEVRFVLFHFSLRYKDADILDFFEREKEAHSFDNIKVWAQDDSSESKYCELCSG